MKKQIFLSLILTIICLFATNKLWLVFKPMPVNFNMFGNGTYKVSVVLNKKDNNKFEKVKKATKKVKLSNDEKKITLKIKRAKFPKRLKLVILHDNTSKDYQTIYVSNFRLNKERIKITSEKDFSVKNATIKVADSKLYITPINKENIEIIYNTPLHVRSSMSFKFHIFLFFFILPSLLVFYANKYKNEIFAYINKFFEYCKNNKKIVIISLLLAIIFTILTPHWWVKTEYWKNKIKVSTISHFKLQIEDKADLKSGRYSISKVNYLLNSKKINEFVEIVNNGTLSQCTYKFTIPVLINGITSNTSFIVNTNNDIKIIFPKNINVSSFKINNIEYNKKFKNNDGKLVLKNLYGKKLNITYSANLKSANLKVERISIFGKISYINLFLSFILYFLLSNLILIKKNKLKFFIFEYKNDIIFLFFCFIVYFLLNHYVMFNTYYTAAYNIFFGADITWRLANVLSMSIPRYHSYFFIPFYPIFDIIFLLTKNITLTLMIIYSLLTSFTVIFVKKILDNINLKFNRLNIILTLIFGFSYTVIIIYCTFETYPITAFYLALIVLLIIKELKSKEYNEVNMFFISLLIALTFGVTVSNIITVFILLLSIFIIKRQPKKILKNILSIIIFITLFLTFATNISSSSAWKASNVFKLKENILIWTSKETKIGFVKQTLRMPMLAQDKEYSKIIMNGFWVCFASMILLSLILLIKSPIKKEDKALFISLLLALIYNFVANYYWDQNEGFLFAPNHFALWFVIFAYCLKIIDEELKKHKMTINNNFVIAILVLFLLVEIPTNYIANKKVQNYAMKKYPLTSPIIEVVK